MLLKHKSSVEEAREELEKMRNALEEELKGRRAELADVESRWKQEMDALSQARAEIRKEKSSLRTLVQGDLNALSEKEDELVKAVKEFEKDRRKLATEEDRLVARVRELERTAHEHGKVEAQFKAREQALVNFEDALNKKEAILNKSLKQAEEARKKAEELRAKISKVKETKADIKRLTFIRNELEWTIERESRKVIALGGKLHHLEEKVQVAKHPTAPKQKISKQPMPHKLTPAAPEEPGMMEDHQESGIAAARPSEIPHLLNQAHDAITANDMQTAKRVLEKLQHVHAQLKNIEAKRTLGYEILDIKASIKLAALS